MDEHPIQGLMKTAMESIKDMIEVNTVVGDAVETPDGTIIMPVTRVAFGFAAGGAEYGTGSRSSSSKDEQEDAEGQNKYPFGGGSGAGVSVQPVAFMVVGGSQVKMMPVTISTPVEKMLEQVPQIVSKVKNLMEDGGSNKNMEKNFIDHIEKERKD